MTKFWTSAIRNWLLSILIFSVSYSLLLNSDHSYPIHDFNDLTPAEILTLESLADVPAHVFKSIEENHLLALPTSCLETLEISQANYIPSSELLRLPLDLRRRINEKRTVVVSLEDNYYGIRSLKDFFRLDILGHWIFCGLDFFDVYLEYGYKFMLTAHILFDVIKLFIIEYCPDLLKKLVKQLVYVTIILPKSWLHRTGIFKLVLKCLDRVLSLYHYILRIIRAILNTIYGLAWSPRTFISQVVSKFFFKKESSTSPSEPGKKAPEQPKQRSWFGLPKMLYSNKIPQESPERDPSVEDIEEEVESPASLPMDQMELDQPELLSIEKDGEIPIVESEGTEIEESESVTSVRTPEQTTIGATKADRESVSSTSSTPPKTSHSLFSRMFY